MRINTHLGRKMIKQREQKRTIVHKRIRPTRSLSRMLESMTFAVALKSDLSIVACKDTTGLFESLASFWASTSEERIDRTLPLLCPQFNSVP